MNELPPLQSGNTPPRPVFELKDKLELYKVYRAQIEHEDNLVNQRLTWLLFSEAFLFTAYFTGLNNFLDDSKATIIKHNGIFCLLLVIAVAGILLVFFGFRSIYGAFEAVKSIRKQWYFHFPEEGYAEMDNSYYYPNTYPDIFQKPIKKQFPDITYLGDNKFKSDLQNPNPDYSSKQSIKSTLETLDLMFKKAVGSRTTAFGTPAVIFSMWVMTIIIQFFTLIPVVKDESLKKTETMKLEIKVIKSLDAEVSVYDDSIANRIIDTNVEKSVTGNTNSILDTISRKSPIHQ